MALGDYFNGPKHRQRVQELEKELAELRQRYGQIQAIAQKFGAMEALQVQDLISQENAKLNAVRLTIQAAEQNVAALSKQTTELRGQILVLEETILLESFALYEPKFKLNASHEYKTRLDAVRERQKAMIKNGEAASQDGALVQEVPLGGLHHDAGTRRTRPQMDKLCGNRKECIRHSRSLRPWSTGSHPATRPRDSEPVDCAQST